MAPNKKHGLYGYWITQVLTNIRKTGFVSGLRNTKNSGSGVRKTIVSQALDSVRTFDWEVFLIVGSFTMLALAISLFVVWMGNT